MNSTDMFSVKKVALHGMQDSRWKTQDKVTQYKGTINLYVRDKFVLGSDSISLTKKTSKAVSEIKKEIQELKTRLSQAQFGDLQKIRNSLAEERSLQLAYQHLHPTVIIAKISQNNFNLRKILDKLKYKLGMRENELIQMKLAISELEDRLEYDDLGQLPDEKQVGLVTGEVQDAILKMEAAITVEHTYRDLIQIMKKDAIYYEAILKSIEIDLYKQHRCMKNTIVLGQLAMENLDDRRTEYQSMERRVKQGIKTRLATIEELSDKFQKMVFNVRNLIRRDSDTNVRSKQISEEDLSLRHEIIDLGEIFKKLRNATKSGDYSQIMPCLEAQVELKQRLINMVECMSEKRDRLLNKTNHAQMMFDFLVSSVSDCLEEYKRSKKELLTNIAGQQARLESCSAKRVRMGALITNMRASLELLIQNCQMVKDSDGRRKSLTTKLSTTRADEFIQKFVSVERNTSKMLDVLTVKIHQLEKLAPSQTKLTTRQLEDAETTILGLIANRHVSDHRRKSNIEEVSLLDDLVVEDLGVPTRLDIKRISDEIVKANQITDDMLPISEPKMKHHRYKPKPKSKPKKHK